MSNGEAMNNCQVTKPKMMKRNHILLAGLLVLLIIGTKCLAQEASKTKILEGKSQARYTSEPYTGFVKLELQGEKIVKVEFQVIDTLNNEVFGSDYEKHFPDNELYQKQCRNDWQGVLNYPKQLVEKQNIEKVDAISGATWSYNIFKASVLEAIKKSASAK